MHITIYDATLREGAQSAGASFSLEDKLKIVRQLDELGVDYIEAGNPGSNPKDARLYQILKENPPKHAKLAAFGSTCRVGVVPEDDYHVCSLLSAQTPVVTIFGKSWDFHVREVLRTDLAENLRIVEQTVRYLKEQGKEVVFDAEHFFDGCKHNLEYALEVLRTAEKAGADWIALCDTNGGCMVHEIEQYTRLASGTVKVPLGIHCHNDTGQAVSCSIAALRSGASMAQLTLNGWGERCGNADFFTLVPNLQLKMGCDCIRPEALKNLVEISRATYEMVNRTPDKRAPYVGRDAFSHKAGMHIDAVNKAPASFEHVPPESVGASRRILLSEISGRGALITKIRAVVPEMTRDSPFVGELLDELKRMESHGYQFEGADASFELLVRRKLGLVKSYFDFREYKVVGCDPSDAGHTATAMVRMIVGGVEEITAADGDGPVNALDRAARKALERFYPELAEMRLTDFKVRVITAKGTASGVRVMIESTDGRMSWTTVGVDSDILKASSRALMDSLVFKLLKGDLEKE